MQKQNVKLIPISTALLLMLLGCSPKKQDEKKEEAGKMEMPDTKAADAVATTKVKAFENVEPSVKTQINGFLADYLAVNQALIEDNQDRARSAAKKLAVTVSKFDMSKLMGDQMDFYHTQLAKLNRSLKGISESADIEETRLELATLSEAIYALVKAYHPNESELYLQFCPMARNGEGAKWLSTTKEIVNPYMGQRMPHCGRTEETIN